MPRLALGLRIAGAFVGGWLLTSLLYLIPDVRESLSFGSWMKATLMAPGVLSRAALEDAGSAPWGPLLAFGFAVLGIAPLALGAIVVWRRHESRLRLLCYGIIAVWWLAFALFWFVYAFWSRVIA